MLVKSVGMFTCEALFIGIEILGGVLFKFAFVSCFIVKPSGNELRLFIVISLFDSLFCLLLAFKNDKVLTYILFDAKLWPIDGLFDTICSTTLSIYTLIEKFVAI